MKKTFDFFIALIGLLISLPLWIIFALAIWFEDRRPIFYLQERVGKDGKIFKTLKFRSMLHEAEKELGPIQAEWNDTRVTRIGRLLRATAMDELPQLINILKGDMSFVGPRALRLIEIDDKDKNPRSILEFEGFQVRCRIKPGLTGIAQVLAPRNIAHIEKFKYDIWYIHNQNFWLDTRIIAISFLITFLGKWETREKKFKNVAKKLQNDIYKEICSHQK